MTNQYCSVKGHNVDPRNCSFRSYACLCMNPQNRGYSCGDLDSSTKPPLLIKERLKAPVVFLDPRRLPA